MDREPKASTTSGLWSSSFTTGALAFLSAGASRWSGAFMRRSSSVSNGWFSDDSCAWDVRSASSSSRTRVASSEIFSWSSCVEARTNLPLHYQYTLSFCNCHNLTDFLALSSANPICAWRQKWIISSSIWHTSGQIAPHPRLTHELQGIALSHRSFSLGRIFRKI